MVNKGKVLRTVYSKYPINASYDLRNSASRN